ncbi:trigger factor [Rhodospirillaceae bacterium SYSU D60014]|uniref:trigger factor n=1 Tax=Virgifigura deserti TaxID=2268457 RepID=UPI000E67522F
MQVTETTADGLKREFKVVIPASDVQEKMDHRLQELGKTIRMPGFRPGKVPLQLLKQRFGQSIMGEIIERTVTDSSTQVMTERNLRPAVQPKIEIVSFPEGADLEYSMALEVVPEITPMDFSTLELERLTVDIPDSEIDEALQRLAQRQRKSEPLATPRPAQNGDVVVIDFTGRIDGVEFPGGAATDHYLELGSGSLIPGFEEQLVGANAGDQVTVTVTFPEDYPNKELAGKEAAFDVTIKEIREPVAATIDDELAKSFGLEDLAAMRGSVREQIEKEYGGVSRGKLKRQLLDALAAEHDFEVPAGMVEAEFEGIWRQIESDREQGRLDEEDAAKSEDDLKADYRAIAERRVRLGLLLSEVGRLNNIQVSNDELTRAILAEARRYPGQERKVMEFYQKSPEALAQVRAPLYEDKVIDYILELAKVSDRKVEPATLLEESSEAPSGDEAKKAKPKAKAKAKTTAKRKKADDSDSAEDEAKPKAKAKAKVTKKAESE